MGVAFGAVVALGCSDPAAPPPQGAVYMRIKSAQTPDTPPGKVCSIQAHNATIGDPPSTTTKGKPVVDEDTGKVSCKVTAGGSFSASASYGSTSFAISSGSLKGKTGTAIIQEYDPTSAVNLISPKAPDADGYGRPCNVSVDVDKLSVAAGRVWAKFDCPALFNSGQPNLWCAGDGVFVFENCEE